MDSKKATSAALSPIIKFIIVAIVLLVASSIIFRPEITNWADKYTAEQLDILQDKSHSAPGYQDIVTATSELETMQKYVKKLTSELEGAVKTNPVGFCIINLSESMPDSFGDGEQLKDANFKYFFDDVSKRLFVNLDVKNQRQTEEVHRPLVGITSINILDDGYNSDSVSDVSTHIQNFESKLSNQYKDYAASKVRYVELKKKGLIFKSPLEIWPKTESYTQEFFIYFQGNLEPFAPYKEGDKKDKIDVKDFSKQFVIKSDANLYFIEHPGFPVRDADLC